MFRFSAGQAAPQQAEGGAKVHTGRVGRRFHLVFAQQSLAVVYLHGAHRLALFHRGFQLLGQASLRGQRGQRRRALPGQQNGLRQSGIIQRHAVNCKGWTSGAGSGAACQPPKP